MNQMMLPTNEVNVTRLIDDGPLTRFQIGTIVCCALVSVLDGIDTQSIGVAAPFIADGLGIKIANFGPIFSVGAVGCDDRRRFFRSACGSPGPQDTS